MKPGLDLQALFGNLSYKDIIYPQGFSCLQGMVRIVTLSKPCLQKSVFHFPAGHNLNGIVPCKGRDQRIEKFTVITKGFNVSWPQIKNSNNGFGCPGQVVNKKNAKKKAKNRKTPGHGLTSQLNLILAEDLFNFV
jgi:hypothetical protein